MDQKTGTVIVDMADFEPSQLHLGKTIPPMGRSENFKLKLVYEKEGKRHNCLFRAFNGRTYKGIEMRHVKKDKFEHKFYNCGVTFPDDVDESTPQGRGFRLLQDRCRELVKTSPATAENEAWEIEENIIRAINPKKGKKKYYEPLGEPTYRTKTKTKDGQLVELNTDTVNGVLINVENGEPVKRFGWNVRMDVDIEDGNLSKDVEIYSMDSDTKTFNPIDHNNLAGKRVHSVVFEIRAIRVKKDGIVVNHDIYLRHLVVEPSANDVTPMNVDMNDLSNRILSSEMELDKPSNKRKAPTPLSSSGGDKDATKPAPVPTPTATQDAPAKKKTKK